MAYKAKSGDSYSKISKKLMIPEEDLRASNKGVVTLKAGQVLNTPPVFSGNAIQSGTNRTVMNRRYGEGDAQPALTLSGFATTVNDLVSPFMPGNLSQTFSRSEQTESKRRNKGGDVNPMLARNPFMGTSVQGGTSAVPGNMPQLPIPSWSPVQFQQPIQPAKQPAGQPSVYIPSNRNINVGPVAYTPQNQPTSPYPPFQTPTTNGFTAQQPPPPPRRPTGTQPQQPYLGASSYLNPAYQQGQASSPITSPAKLTPPTGADGKPILYTGDPKDPNTAKWIAYWNNAVAHPELYAGERTAPRVMTRAEIWEMKAAQRRKRMEQGDDQGNTVSYQGAGYVPSQNASDPQNTYAYPDIIRNIVWGG